MALSRERTDAQATYPADLQTVEKHDSLDVAIGGDFIAKPMNGVTPMATHLQIQALEQNVRYTIDGSPATIGFGFQLAAGAITTIPIPNLGISIFEEAAGAIVQFQWMR